ncbi:hypothetical protein EWM64_g8375 [Hericium alpestre]|uniref:Calcineurin-like phosphoesterase domain-containing protein n=1 Tax=Hericium alpestre TaxID=135208 RepID=A0A4Y9ZNL2_9AGAM|nr:hypothetical protein EWM64_g8375 [Hericium alpestre]
MSPTPIASSASATVYDNYGTDIPPHPGGNWTRFVCISDTHSRVYPVPPGDVLLHAGDLSSWGTVEQLQLTVDWLMSLEHPTKVAIAGNHDLCLDRKWIDLPRRYKHGTGICGEDVVRAREMLSSEAMRRAGFYFLEHQSIEFDTAAGRRWKVYGSPATPFFVHGAFQYSGAEEGEAIHARIPPDTEILLTHTPPHLTLDQARRGVNAGCPYLAARVAALRACRLHVFGHIHEAHGAVLHEGGRVSVNAALPSGGQAIIVDLRN